MFKANRLFFALWPDELLLKTLHAHARDLDLRNQPGGRITPAERLHLTLLFLGDAIPPEIELEVRHAVRSVRCEPFSLKLDTANSFKVTSQRSATSTSTYTWWIGSQAPSPELASLRQSILESLKGITLTPDRKRFLPHISIIRGAGRNLPPAPLPPMTMPVSHFALVRSHIGQGQNRYEEIERWPLQKEAAPQTGQQQSLW